MPRYATVFLTLLVALAMSGCSGQSSPPASIDGGQDAGATATKGTSDPTETFPYTVTQQVEYYTSGPQQGRPPDGKLAAGTKINVLRRTGGYSLVHTAEGIEGYISTDAIQDPSAAALE